MNQNEVRTMFCLEAKETGSKKAGLKLQFIHPAIRAEVIGALSKAKQELTITTFEEPRV